MEGLGRTALRLKRFEEGLLQCQPVPAAFERGQGTAGSRMTDEWQMLKSLPPPEKMQLKSSHHEKQNEKAQNEHPGWPCQMSRFDGQLSCSRLSSKSPLHQALAPLQAPAISSGFRHLWSLHHAALPLWFIPDPCLTHTELLGGRAHITVTPVPLELSLMAGLRLIFI